MDDRATFTSWLYRPYIDLTPEAPEGNPQTAGLLLALAAVEGDEHYPRIHGLYPPSIRLDLVVQARLPEYAVSDPLDLPRDLWTPQWEMLCEHLKTPGTSEQRNRVLWLLHRLHLHHAVLHYAEDDRLHYAQDDRTFDALFIRGSSRLALYHDDLTDLDTSEFEYVAYRAPEGSWAAVEATYFLTQIAATRKRDVEETRAWAAAHLIQVKKASQIADSFSDHHTAVKLWSRYHRVHAFVPMLYRQREAMVDEMDRAESYHAMMSTDTPEQEAETSVLGSALFESRAKEASMLDDLAEAEAHARRFVALAPLDPLSHTCLGQVLNKIGRFDEARESWRLAARYGPPGTATSWFMVGKCSEHLGEHDAACDAYLLALELDPLGIGSLERLIEVGDTITKRWAEERLAALSAFA